MIEEIAGFIQQYDLPRLYLDYSWESDTWDAGFPDILRLELSISSHCRTGGVLLEDVKEVARWGRLRNAGRIAGADIVLPEGACKGSNKLHALEILQSRITSGAGPTYMSKVLRFAAPQRFACIDTRCVRVFGGGDHAGGRHRWLQLKAVNSGYGWSIPAAQSAWPLGYLRWLGIIETFISLLKVPCPHPKAFLDQGLREPGVWYCADVEMALFSYASNMLETSKRDR